MDAKKWWSKAPGVAWNKARATVMAAWDRLIGTEARMQKAVAEGAVAFGREGRAAYADFGDWSDLVETRLAADWREAGREVEQAWDSVKAAVRHGWDTALDADAPTADGMATVTPSASKASGKAPRGSAKAGKAATGKGAVKGAGLSSGSGAKPEGGVTLAQSLGTPARTGRTSAKAAAKGAKGNTRKPRVSGTRGGTGTRAKATSARPAEDVRPAPVRAAPVRSEPEAPLLADEPTARQRPVTSRGHGAVRRHPTK